MLQGQQLGKSGQVFVLPPATETSAQMDVLSDVLSAAHHGSKFGLGDADIQRPFPTRFIHALSSLFISYALMDAVQSSFKLELLKRHKFTPDGREQRIRDSLAALNAPQPTTLTAAEWKEIIEEVEEED